MRGKILVKGTDTDRATPIVTHIEQFVDYAFNWMVQLMMVYYDSPRNVSRTQGDTFIQSSEFTHPLVVSVKEGSMVPKDRLTQRNEAVELAQANLIDPLTFAERLEDPNPQEFAKRLVLWRLNPVAYAQVYVPEVAPAVVPPVLSPEEQSIPEEPKVESENLLAQVPIS